MTATWMAAWKSSLEKLGNLRRLSVDCYPVSCCAAALDSFAHPFPALKELDVAGWTFSRIPKWISGLHEIWGEGGVISAGMILASSASYGPSPYLTCASKAMSLQKELS